MTERTYGNIEWSLKQIEQSFNVADLEWDLAAHIRELEAEVERLKAERREFGVRVATAVDDLCVGRYGDAGGPYGEVLPEELEKIVEQELAK